MFDADLTAFLESGCSTIVGLLTPSGEPFATRGWGTDVLSAAPPRLRLLVGEAELRSVGRRPGDGARFAVGVTGANVITLRSVQVKGTAYDLAHPTEADIERSARFCDAFFGDVQSGDAIPRSLMERIVPTDLLVCTIDVEAIYDQTPGPGAGARLSHR